jgi:dynein heavy chain 1
LESLADAHFLYQYSLPFFLVIIETVLTKSGDLLKDQKDPMKRLQLLVRSLFETSFQRVARGLLNRDQLPFALRLTQIMLDDAPSLLDASAQCHLGVPEVDFFLKGKLLSPPRDDIVFSKLPLSSGQRNGLAQLAGLSSMTAIVDHMAANQSDWVNFIEEVVKEKEESDSKESSVAATSPASFTPTGWEKATTNTARLFYQMLVCKVLRPDRLPAVSAAFVTSVFGAQFLQSAQNVDLAAIVRDEAKALSPLMLVSKPGFDASGKVDALAQVTAGVNYQSFATGTPEGADQAEAAVTQAAKSGGWVLLKNVHLLPKWLAKLEKKLHRITPLHPNFRLFMTMEMNPKVPATLLRLSTKIVFEPPVGIKSSLRRMFTALPSSRVNKAPVERSRLYFLLAWLHAVVLERLRYTPVGWSKEFEFSETDQQCAMDAVDEWIDKMAAGRANIAPASIPWDALQACLEFIVYGGRIDNEFDQVDFLFISFTP